MMKKKSNIYIYIGDDSNLVDCDAMDNAPVDTVSDASDYII